MKKLFAKISTTNYKGTYEVVEILGRIIACKVDGKTTDFSFDEVVRFCDEEEKNFSFKPNK